MAPSYGPQHRSATVATPFRSASNRTSPAKAQAVEDNCRAWSCQPGHRGHNPISIALGFETTKQVEEPRITTSPFLTLEL